MRWRDVQQSSDTLVIAASRGGVEALSTFLGALPADLPVAVLIVLHTAPNSPRLLAGILGRCTAFAVSYGEDGATVQTGQIYLAPPDFHMTVSPPGIIRLNHGEKERFSRPAADPLFRTAASVFGRDLIGIVLTGGDGDGTAGLQAVHAAGGICVVQEPTDAKDPSMPISAMIGAHPEHIVSIGKLAPLIVRLVERRRAPSDP